MKVKTNIVNEPHLKIEIEITQEEYTKFCRVLYETRWGECSPESRTFMVGLENNILNNTPRDWNVKAWDDNRANREREKP